MARSVFLLVCCTLLLFVAGCSERKLAPTADYNPKNVETIRGELFTDAESSVD